MLFRSDEHVSAEDVAEYYATAPDIVAGIRRREDAELCFEQLSYTIFSAYGAIVCGQNALAYRLYRAAYEIAQSMAEGD